MIERKSGVSIAEYDPKENAVKETTIFSDSYYSPAIRDAFITAAIEGKAVYSWYHDNYQVNIMSTSHAYNQEYKKVID